MMIEKIGQDVVLPLVNLWNSFVYSLPYVIGGLLVIAFGYLLGEVLEIIVIKVLNKIKFNEFMHSLKISDKIQKVDLSHILGVILKWYIFVVFLVPAANLAKLGDFSVMLMSFAIWLPSFILGIIIVLLGWIGADIVGNKIEATKIEARKFVSTLVRTVLILFVLVIALEEMGVNVSLIHQTFLIVLSAFGLGFAIAFGIGFGLAMKDEAGKIIKDVKRKM